MSSLPPQVDTSPPEWYEVLRARHHHTEGISVHVSVLIIMRISVKDACELTVHCLVLPRNCYTMCL